MTVRPPRSAEPRRWHSLALAGASLGLAAAAAAAPPGTLLLPDGRPGVWLAQSAGGEGGEGGEAGAVAGAAPDVAYLARLHIVEGHLRGAAELYRLGRRDEAAGVAFHPEAEMMDEVRAALAARGVADVTPALAAVGDAMLDGAAAAEVQARLDALLAALAAAAAPEAGDYRARFDALALTVRAAAAEYGEAVAGGQVADLTPYVEAWGFVQTAKALAAGLAAAPDPAAAEAGAKALAALAGADALFGGLGSEAPAAGDPGVLLAMSSRIELAASRVGR